MRPVVQRISRMKVNGELTGQIAVGLLVLLGVTHADRESDAAYLAESPIRRIANAFTLPQRVCSGGPHRSHTCYGYRLAHATLDAIALADERLAYQADAAPHRLVARPASSGGDFDMGLVLPVARMSARRRNGVLLFRVYLHDPWLRRCAAGKAVATAGTNRKLDGRSHVRFVHWLLLRRLESHLSIAAGNTHRCFRFRRIGVRRVPLVAAGTLTNRN